MKRILNFTSVSLAFMAAIFLYSCESEPSEPTNVKPVVTLTSSSDITVEPEETFTVDFSASKGDDTPLNAVTVYEDGSVVPFSRLKVNGVDASSNGILLFGSDVDGLTWSIDIVAHSTAASTVTYEIQVQDEALQKQSVFVNVTTAGTPPSLTTTTPTTLELAQDQKNAFMFSAVKGSGDLVSIEVRENDQLVDPSKLFWQVISMSVADNPFTLAEAEQGGFDDQELFIMTPASEGNFIYKVVLTDEYGLTAQLEFDITTLPSTPVDMLEGVLLNSGGPDGTGGLDLDNGKSTDSNDTEAEIKDNGIDINLPPEDNWLRTISPIADNGVSMRYLKAGEGGLPEGFTFSSIEFKEDLEGLFANGVELVDGASEVVQIEDVFIVARDNRYWVLEVIEIVTDPNNNEDSYTFDIKY